MIGWCQLLVISTCVSLFVSVDGQTPCSTDPFRTAIRLNDGGVFKNGSGRVEICECADFFDGSTCYWNTVTTGSNSVPMGWKNSIVVCRQLGYTDVQSPILQNTVDSSIFTNSPAEISRVLYNCDGTETILSQCGFVVTTGILTHSANAFVNCFTDLATQRVRIISGYGPDSEGAVEYYMNQYKPWKTICPDSWSDTEANVVCTSLGYVSGTAETVFGAVGPNIDLLPSISSVSCTGNEKYFGACSFVLGSSCFSNALAGVSCVADTVDDGSVRLYDIDDTNGFDRVEVYYAGRWGTVCNIAWDKQDGGVVCGELGIDVSFIIVPGGISNFNSLSSRPIWISGYNCDGTETGLSDCPNVFAVGSVSALCSHSNDAGLVCLPPENISGGLSGGAIAGIVIGSLVLIGIVVWLVWCQNKMKNKRLAEAYTRRAGQSTAAVAQVTVEMDTTQQQTQPVTPETVTTPPANPSNSQAPPPPPTYEEVLHHMDEEKSNQDQDPAYLSAPPGPNNYQEPTHPGYTPPGVVMPSPDRGMNRPPFPPTEGNAPYLYPPTHDEDLPHQN